VARVIEGRLVDPGGRFAMVAARFNDFITDRLIAGCEGAFAAHGIDPAERLDLIWVPGAFELPLACQRAAKSGQYAGVIALGAVIRGSTPHFDYVAGEAAKGVSRVSIDTGVPVIFGVLTTESIEQAIERAGTKAGNNGYKAGCAAIEMVSLLQQLGA
jgi:6,7-dimethyl-8-ribityllumazine synthase